MRLRAHFHELPPDTRAYGDTGTVLIATRFRIEASGDPLPYVVLVDVEVDDEGTHARQVTITEGDQGPVTTEGIRRVPLGRIMAEGVQLAVFRPIVSPAGEVIGALSSPPVDEVTSAARESTSRRRRWRLTDDHLREVAEVFTAASRRHEPGRVPAPVRAVATRFDVAYKAASNWVTEARRRIDPDTGEPFLPPATTGRGKTSPVAPQQEDER